MTEMAVSVTTAQKLQQRPLPRVMGRLRLARFLALPENEFRKFIDEVERDALFRRLAYPDTSSEKVITYRRFPNTAAAAPLCELNEGVLPGSVPSGIEELLAGNQRLTDTIRSLGIERFQRFFLYNESPLGIDDISRECHLSKEEIREIIALVNAVSLRAEFLSAVPASAPYPRYRKVAAIEKDRSAYAEMQANESWQDAVARVAGDMVSDLKSAL